MASLLININNSFTKIAATRGKGMGAVTRIPTARLGVAQLRTLRKKFPRHAVIVSSVVPSKNRAVKQVFGPKTFFVTGTADLGFPVTYPRKKEIGADRLANAAAAIALYGAPAIVVDFGTALTFDIIDAHGAYCGGVIAPGLNALTDYLHERTALLPRVRVREPRRAIGKSTEEAMRVGAVIGYRGLVREILKALRRELGPRRPYVVATGGQAALVARGLPEIREVNPLLTLQGLHIMAARRS